jgi:hypothetical protein
LYGMELIEYLVNLEDKYDWFKWYYKSF